MSRIGSTTTSIATALIIIGLTSSALSAQQGKAAKKVAAAPVSKGPTYKVEKGPFKVIVSLKGTFEAEDMKEVYVSPRAWTPNTGGAPLTVLKAVEHGTSVKKGDLVLELDLEKIDRAIKDLKADSALAQAAIQQAEEELPLVEKSLPLELAAADRAKRVADEDLERFLKVDRALAEEQAKRHVESSEHYLQSAQEELKQLEKMYRSKDLTEETEEFILKRTRFQVRMAEFSLKSAKIASEHTLKTELPRREKNLQENAARLEVALEKARNTLPLVLNQKRLALQKMKYDHVKSSERLAQMEKDREMMTVRAPADGIVYHGKCQNGVWSMDGGKLHRGGMIAPEETFMTIVNSRPAFVRATIEEKELHLLRPGMKGKAVVSGYPDLKLPAELVRISAIATTPGKFDARIAVTLGPDTKAITPGMECTVKFVAYEKSDALTVPATAVFTDDGDADDHYVYLISKGSAPAKHPVKVGRTGGGKTEIDSGLNAGDEILTSKPESK